MCDEGCALYQCRYDCSLNAWGAYLGARQLDSACRCNHSSVCQRLGRLRFEAYLDAFLAEVASSAEAVKWETKRFAREKGLKDREAEMLAPIEQARRMWLGRVFDLRNALVHAEGYVPKLISLGQGATMHLPIDPQIAQAGYSQLDITDDCDEILRHLRHLIEETRQKRRRMAQEQGQPQESR